MKILRRKSDNVVIFAGEDSISITVVANNAFWVDHGNGNKYTMQDADQFEVIEDVTLPDGFDTKKHTLTKNGADEWVWGDNPKWAAEQAWRARATSKGPKDPQPYPSWTFNEDKWEWIPPTKCPAGFDGRWDEDNQTWVER